VIGELSALEAVDGCLARIEELARLNAFTQVFAEEARARARELDSRSERGPLHGVPVAVKDLMAIAGHPTTCGTELHRHAPPAAVSADAVAALEAAGAVVVGATNLHEWANGPTSSNPHFGPVRNPWDEERVPGGSSGGSAVAVATGMAWVALGTDTAGSVRIPAACTGTAALKPGSGRVPMGGVFPLSWSLDTVGPHAARVADLELPYRVLAGERRPLPTVGLAGLRLGVEQTWYLQRGRIDPPVLELFERVLGELERAGAQLVEVAIPELEGAETAEHAILLAEASAVHDGDRRADRVEYGDEVRGYFEAGDRVLAIDYIRALRSREVLYDGFVRAFGDIDFAVSPTLPMLPPLIGETAHEWPDGSVGSVGELWRHTFPSNLADLPSLSQPCGFAEGLPVGLQLIGPRDSELGLLALGTAIEELLA
jgi:aspartyl-tRNA(Asn)/glutamyl-tRNA(Gln) amidotransferase subunit A